METRQTNSLCGRGALTPQAVMLIHGWLPPASTLREVITEGLHQQRRAAAVSLQLQKNSRGIIFFKTTSGLT